MLSSWFIPIFAGAATVYPESIEALAQAIVSATDRQAFLDSAVVALQSMTSAADAQQFVDNLEILILSHASLADIMAYIDQVTVVAQGAASLDEVLMGAFIGAYLRGQEVIPRTFITEVRAR